MSIGFTNVSPDGRFIAWGESDGGSDLRTIRVRNVDTGQDLPDTIKWAKFTTASWLPASSGFTYSGYSEPANPLEQTNANMRVYFHTLGETQAQDRLVHADPAHPTLRTYARIPAGDERRWLSVADTTSENVLYYQSLERPDAPIVLVPDTTGGSSVALRDSGNYVQATLRGGGEYGRAWHQAGTKLQKQNVFDDFIAVAEWLIDKKWTSRTRLAIEGRSNGGLLVGAAMTQRPDLFAAAIPTVGVLDMLRYHQFTIGAAWAGDYGRTDDSPEMFKYLRSYSPVHNVRRGVDYPATLIMTGERDDRVVPAHSFKFGATLQADNASDRPIIVRVETRAGHGAGTSTDQAIAQAADQLAFLDANLGTTPLVPEPVFLPPRR